MRFTCLSIAMVVFIVGLFTSCVEGDSQAPETVTLENTTWNLSSIALSGVMIPAEEEQELSFRLETDDGVNIVRATADCNQCGGPYILGVADSISISIGCTEMYCGDDSQGEFFADALGSATTYDLDNGTLRIFFSNQIISGTLIFEALRD